MRTYSVALFLAVVLPVIAAPPGSGGNGYEAEQNDTAWAKVERLRRGQAVRVMCSDQRVLTGRLSGASATSIALEIGGTERKTDRSEVVQVQVKSRALSAIAGSVIGAGAGAGVGYAAGSGLKGGERTTAAGLGAGLFAAAGAGIGSLFPGWKTVYLSESSGSSPQDRLFRK